MAYVTGGFGGRRGIVAAALAMVCVAGTLEAAPVVSVEKAGMERTVVSVETQSPTPEAKAFNDCLRRNISISGVFILGDSGSVKVAGVPGAGVTVTGNGRQISFPRKFTDAKSARMAARELVDAMVANYGGEGAKGFATDRIVFVNRLGSDNADLYTAYADGYDIRCESREGHAIVGPRWAPNGRDIYFTGFREKTPLIYKFDGTAGKIKRLAPFKGLATGAAISPDGRKAALILSFQGNPELYVMDLADGSVQRITRTRGASEASPCWSPDGSRIAYVSDETRSPQIYIVDVATKKSVRFTNQGSQNTNPDWSARGGLTWATKRQGVNYIAVADPAAGERSHRLVTDGGSWEHPTWASDGRHIAADRDRAIFLIDADPESDTKPVQMFLNKGNWMSPSFTR